MRFKKIKIWEGVDSHKKSHKERLLLTTLGERALYYTLDKTFLNKFGCCRAKIVKKYVENM